MEARVLFRGEDGRRRLPVIDAAHRLRKLHAHLSFEGRRIDRDPGQRCARRTVQDHLRRADHGFPIGRWKTHHQHHLTLHTRCDRQGQLLTVSPGCVQDQTFRRDSRRPVPHGIPLHRAIRRLALGRVEREMDDLPAGRERTGGKSQRSPGGSSNPVNMLRKIRRWVSSISVTMVSIAAAVSFIVWWNDSVSPRPQT